MPELNVITAETLLRILVRIAKQFVSLAENELRVISLAKREPKK